MAIIGGAPLAQTNGLFQALAVNALNALLGSVEAPGGVSFMPQADSAAGWRPATTRARCGSWPRTFSRPRGRRCRCCSSMASTRCLRRRRAWRVRDAVLKVPFIVSFGSFIDDTSVLADLILPDHSFLESWTDARPESGASVALATVAGPAMKPLHQTRATPDVLLDVARKLKQPLKPELPWQTFDQMLQARSARTTGRPPTSRGGCGLNGKGLRLKGQRAES